MLVSLSAANFRSIHDEVTLSLVASKALSGAHPDHAVSIPHSGDDVLRTAVIYGANGAGKSNIFLALKYVASMAIEPRKKKARTGREPFRFASNAGDTSSFDLRFIANDDLYRFGFKVDDSRVVEEWLVKEVGSRERVIYERCTTEEGAVSIDAPDLRKVGSKLDALVTVGGPANQSFLATVRANLQPDDVGDDLRNVIGWFHEDLQLIGPDDPIAPIAHYLQTNEKFAGLAGEILRQASTGVDRLSIDKREISESELRARFPDYLVENLLKDITEEESETALISLPSGEGEILIEKGDANHFYDISVGAVHKCSQGEVSLPLSLESDGTRRLLNLIPALNHSERSGIYFIDEIDRSLHPMLIWKFLETFLKSCRGSRHQIVVTTHESHLLDLDLLRRDEIWFAEKNQDLATSLYSLSDFRVRKDLGIRKHYLQGRFGAVPFLGNIDNLFAEERANGEG